MSKGRKRAKPQSKKLAALLEGMRRKTGVRDLAKRFLIVCEDDKSAPSYFHALKRRFGLSAASVEVVGSGGHSQPVQVVRRAVDRQAASADPDSGTEPFDEVWCVIDGDYGSKINNARTSAVVHGVELAISTPCFEYWILLHFEASAVPAAKCDVVVHSLKERHLPDYEKGACDFDSMLEHVHDACARAKRLREPGIKRGEAPRTRTHAARSTGW